jgi:hypothetical protein
LPPVARSARASSISGAVVSAPSRTGDDQAQLAGQRPQRRPRLGVVVGVVDLDAGQAGLGQLPHDGGRHDRAA